MRYVMGIDAGTSSVKGEIIDENGVYRFARSAGQPINSPARGWAEQHPDDWWKATRKVIDSLRTQVAMQPGDEVSLGFTGQMHSLVLLGEEQEALRPSILWADERSTAQSAEINRLVPDFARITGNPPLPAFTLPQLMWVREIEPEVFDRTRYVLVTKDYLRFRATGLIGTEWTDASAMAMLDNQSRQWSEPLLAKVGIPVSLLPEIHAPHAVAGEIRDLFPAGINAVSSYGVGDQFAEALSAGLTDAGQRCIVLGTSAVLLSVTDHPAPGSFCHAPDDRWLRLNSLHSGGMSLTWFQRAFSPEISIPNLIDAAGTATPGSDGLLYLPFLAGERSRIDGLLGAFIGMRHEHSRPTFVRAILEGVAYELLRMSRLDGPLNDEPIVVKGGGAQSTLWAEIIAAVFDRPVRVSTREATFGAAMTAGLMLGRYSSYADAAEAGTIYLPHPRLTRIYTERYSAYLEAIASLEPPAEKRTT